MVNYTTEQKTENKIFITFNKLNSKGEKIQAEIIRTENPGGVKSLPYLWKKNGYTKKVLPSYFSVLTYATDRSGNCRGIYNPQIIDGENKINFDFMLEATEENRERLISEIYKRAFLSEGQEQATK